MAVIEITALNQKIMYFNPWFTIVPPDRRWGENRHTIHTILVLGLVLGPPFDLTSKEGIETQCFVLVLGL